MSGTDKDIPTNSTDVTNTTNVEAKTSPTPTIPTTTTHSRDPYMALRFHSFRILFLGSFIAAFGEQMVNVAIGWELYERTGSALALGLVGLVQVLPIILLSLPAGHLADQFSRKLIVIITLLVLSVSSIGLAILSFLHGPLILFYGCLLLIGGAAAFNGPASSALLPQTVSEEAFENAATWSSSTWQLASMLGPASGGLIIALMHSATLVYVLNAIAVLAFAGLLALLSIKTITAPSHERMTTRSIVEGLTFLRETPVILAAITLDLFAVLLGGATALLPIYAKDILHVGPTGLGWLRTAPSIGALSIALGLAHIPPFKKAGWTLLLAVAGFGIATIIFGLSRSFWLSLAMLAVLGGLDNISVVIRGTLLLTRTPNAMLGRTSAVNSLFIGASNELGGFESGLLAQFLGPTIAVVGGGIGTILVVVAVALIWPQMRHLGTLSAPEQTSKHKIEAEEGIQ